jgi:hypothetical protein
MRGLVYYPPAVWDEALSSIYAARLRDTYRTTEGILGGWCRVIGPYWHYIDRWSHTRESIWITYKGQEYNVPVQCVDIIRTSEIREYVEKEREVPSVIKHPILPPPTVPGSSYDIIGLTEEEIGELLAVLGKLSGGSKLYKLHSQIYDSVPEGVRIHARDRKFTVSIKQVEATALNVRPADTHAPGLV